MEEQKRKDINGSERLTDLEKDVLDEYILDLKNMAAVIPLHEENSRAKYDRENGKGASLKLMRDYFEYILINGELDKEQSKTLNHFLTTV